MSLKYVSGTFTDNGSSSQIEIKQRAIAFIGASGGTTFGAGTVTIELMSPTGAWCASQQVASSSDVLAIDAVIPTVARLTLSGATTPDIDYAIQSDAENLVE